MTSGATCRCRGTAGRRSRCDSQRDHLRQRCRPAGGPSVGLVDEDVWFNAREPIAETFSQDGDRFTVVANDLKSNSSGEPTGDTSIRGTVRGSGTATGSGRPASLAGVRLQDLVHDCKMTPRAADGDFDVDNEETRSSACATPHTPISANASTPAATATCSTGRRACSTTPWPAPHCCRRSPMRRSGHQQRRVLRLPIRGDPALYARDPYWFSDHDPLGSASICGSGAMDSASDDPVSPGRRRLRGTQRWHATTASLGRTASVAAGDDVVVVEL